MIVDIRNINNGAGWGSYVLDQRDHATILLGDTHLGDEICKNLDYKSGNSVNFVISFTQEDNISQEKAREATLEFLKSFLYGFNEDEYHLDLVEHNDTDHLHYHARIPKVNLLTNTQLKLYWHKTDIGYKKAVIDDICHKYDLVTGQELKNTIPNPLHKLDQINKWREEHSQESLSLQSPKLRREAEKQLGEYIGQMNTAGLINSLDDVKAEVISMGFDVLNEGYDRGKGFHYLTIGNDSGKVRLKGDIYAGEFYRHSQEDRAERIKSNQSFRTREQELRESGADIKQSLQRERNKRLRFIEKQYGGARSRAYKKYHDKSIKYHRGGDEFKDRAVGKEQQHSPIQSESHTEADIKGTRININDHGDIWKGDDQEATSYTQKNEYKHSYDPYHDDINIYSRSSNRRISNKTNTNKGLREVGSQRRRRNVIHTNRRDTKFRDNKGQIDDSIRTEINRAIIEATRSFYQRIREDKLNISREYEQFEDYGRDATKSIRNRIEESTRHIPEQSSRINEYNKTANKDIGTIQKNIIEFINQYKPRTTERIRKQFKQEDDNYQRSISDIDKTIRGVKEDITSFNERAGELLLKVSSGVQQLFEKITMIIEEKRIQENESQSFTRPTPRRGGPGM